MNGLIDWHHKWRRRIYRSAIALAVATVLGGCAARPKVVAHPAALQSLAELPALKMPEAATQPAAPAPPEALRLYALGRDALLQNKKKEAQTALAAALQLDPASAVAHHDLAYALLGIDNVRAAAEFRQAVGYDPLDADSRLQLARLLVADKEFDAAAVQLRLARQSPDADDDDSLAAMIDLLLGRLLQSTHPAAALECYEHVIALLDAGKLQLRGRAELAELLRQPDILIIQAGDVALACGQFDKAAALYERVRQDNPLASGLLDMRIASAELAAGRTAQATQRALANVVAMHASSASMSAFANLFAEHGGQAAALHQLDLLPAGKGDASPRHVLRSWLLLRQGEATAAVVEIDQASTFDLAAVRHTVHAYRAAGNDAALIKKLIDRTAQQPEQWPAIMRGWAILSQLGQPHPLTADQVAAVPVPTKQQEAAKLFIAAQLHLVQGEPAPAKQSIEAARGADDAIVKVLVASGVEAAVPDDAFDDAAGLASLIADDGDDPELLNALIARLLQQGQKSLAAEALHVANARQPLNVVLASTYAQVLAADEQRTEAIAVLDLAAKAKSASELYFLSSQYSALGENASAEKILRTALDIDPDNVAVCNDLGYLLTDSGRDLETAQTLLQRAVAAAPQNPAYLDSLGWLLYKRSQFTEAARYLTQAVAASDPADPVVLDHAGDALFRDNQHDKAAAAWNEAIAAIRTRGSGDPQLRLRIERKLKQAAAKQAVDLTPVAVKN